MSFRIDSVWMVVSVDEDDEEGVCASSSPLPGLGLVPLIAADERRLPWIIEQAELIRRLSGKKIKIIRLTNREETEL